MLQRKHLFSKFYLSLFPVKNTLLKRKEERKKERERERRKERSTSKFKLKLKEEPVFGSAETVFPFISLGISDDLVLAYRKNLGFGPKAP